MSLFPMFVKLRGRRCVVVGAGRVAAGKASGLLRHGAQVTVVAPRASAWVQARQRAGKLVWRKRQFRAGDVQRSFLVVAATDSAEVNAAVFRACARRGVLCNVVDDAEHCDFFYPAVVERGALQIAISTGGRSPALARRLRRELQQQFGPEYGAWVEQVARARGEVLARALPAGMRGRLLKEIASRSAWEAFAGPRGVRAGRKR